MRDKPGPIHGKCLTCNSRSLTRSLIHLFDRRAGPATRSSGLPFSPSSSLKRYYYIPQLSRLSLETDRILTNVGFLVWIKKKPVLDTMNNDAGLIVTCDGI